MRAPRFRQIPITNYPPATAHEVEQRYRCIEARHEGRTYNPWSDETWCLCGRAAWPGNVARWYTAYERAEVDSGRPDAVGRQARTYLNQAHGHLMAELSTVPSESGDQYVMEVPQ